MFAKKKQVNDLPQDPLWDICTNIKGNMYLHQWVEKNLDDKPGLLPEIKEAMNTLKTMALDTSSKETFFLNEESWRQAFLKWCISENNTA